MISRFLTWLALASLLCSAPAFGDDRMNTLLKGLKDKYGPLPGFKVAYTREVITRSMSMLGQRATGDLAGGLIFFKPPSYLKLLQQTPRPETLLANGDTLWWYIPEKSQVYRYPAEEFGQELRLLSNVLRGLEQAEENFRIAWIGRDEQGAAQLSLQPDPPWREIDHLVLTVSHAYNIQQVDIHNMMGTVTRFRLRDLTIKEKLTPGFFELEVPEGVELIEEGS